MKNYIVELSIVIPVYNSTSTLVELRKNIHEEMEQLGKSFEIIYVDDCSPNFGVRKVLNDLVSSYHGVSAYTLIKNFGQFGATLCGISHARGKYIVTMDDDLQHSPKDISKLYQHIVEHPENDVVVGVPKQKKHSTFRNWGSIIVNYLDVLILGKPKGFKSGSFRIMRHSFSRLLISGKGQNIVLGPLIIKHTKKLANIECGHEERLDGNSGYTIRRLIKATLNNFFSYSSFPMQCVGFFGLSTFIISILFSIYIIYRRIWIGAMPGYSSIVVLVAFFGGAILFALGIIGEYLIRILENTQSSPPYLEEEIIANKK